MKFSADHDKSNSLFIFSAMGTFLFDSRIGLLGLNPPQQSVDFIQNLQGFFRLMSPLTFNFPFYKLFPTSEWRHFQSYADNVFRIGRSFVDKVLPINVFYILLLILYKGLDYIAYSVLVRLWFLCFNTRKMKRILSDLSWDMLFASDKWRKTH